MAWLTPLEQRAWRAFVSVTLVVTAELEAELMAEHGLTLGEYGVLVGLSESPQRRQRMTDLALDLAKPAPPTDGPSLPSSPASAWPSWSGPRLITSPACGA